MPPARILTIIGTRPEAIKLFPVIHALRDDPRFVARVCVSAQHRAMLDQMLAIAGITPDHDLDTMRPGQSLDALTAALVTGLGAVIDAEAPARVLVQGDTTTALAGALAAYYRRVPVDHVEAGLRSGDRYHPWPEEGNRRMISAIAALHFAPTTTAAAALEAEGIGAASILVTGNPVIDALHWVRGRLAAEPGLAAGLDPLAARFAGKAIILVTCHRRENHGAPLARIIAAIRAIAARADVALIVPVHPNPAVESVFTTELAGLANVALIPPLDYPHFTRALMMARIVLTDSGGVQEEAPALGKPVLVLRDTTERPEGIVAGTARLVGTQSDAIVSEIFRLLDDNAAYQAMARAHNPYGDGAAAGRIVEHLAHGIAAPS